MQALGLGAAWLRVSGGTSRGEGGQAGLGRPALVCLTEIGSLQSHTAGPQRLPCEEALPVLWVGTARLFEVAGTHPRTIAWLPQPHRTLWHSNRSPSSPAAGVSGRGKREAGCTARRAGRLHIKSSSRVAPRLAASAPGALPVERLPWPTPSTPCWSGCAPLAAASSRSLMPGRRSAAAGCARRWRRCGHS